MNVLSAASWQQLLWRLGVATTDKAVVRLKHRIVLGAAGIAMIVLPRSVLIAVRL
jgi:hypothetical protein